MKSDDVVRMMDFIDSQSTDMKRWLCFNWFRMRFRQGCYDVSSIISDWHTAFDSQEVR